MCCYGTSIVSLSRAITLKRAEVEKNTPKFCLKNAPVQFHICLGLVLSVSKIVVEPSHVDMLILGKFWFYFPNLGLVDKEAVIRLRIIGLQVSLGKNHRNNLTFHNQIKVFTSPIYGIPQSLDNFSG